MATLNVAFAVLGARFVVLVAVAGGIVLTWLALQSSDPVRLAALGIYSLAIVVPTVWLASRH
jgi:hypothetical protein